ncbi:MAG: acetate--CoA ligase [Candidatus Nitrosocaldus sp.]|nr:acetate--CoA ligase [Candidatus Nitrosocaldus sp.]MDW8276019.1 acetate--CoA ligase [Candidatus Nitrosocaldus sp.]
MLAGSTKITKGTGDGSILMGMRERAARDPEGFWAEQASLLDWFRHWDRVLDWKPPFARWFINGLINASYNALDRHIEDGRGSKVAIHWQGEQDDERRSITYRDMHREVNRLANALKSLGLRKGDRVTIYMPMVPELPVAMLACSRIGVVHSVVFSGFSASALADRINDSHARLVVTADGYYRRGRVIDLRANVDSALNSCKSVEHVILLRRLNDASTSSGGSSGVQYIDWHDLTSRQDEHCEPERVESNEPLFILYTSGTTGKPKGIVHSTGGYLTYANATFRWIFGVRDEDVYFCTADIGWVTGHSYVVYAPLMNATTLIMYEGTPDHPSVHRWFELIERYRATIFYTTPTALRMLMRYNIEYAKAHDLSSLRLLGTVGEPINPEVWLWYYRTIGEERCPVVDTWWQTETGAALIANAAGIELIPMKPGSASIPLPGIDAAVVDEDGKEVRGRKGYLVVRRPWPGLMLTIWGDDERYRKVYWSRFDGVYYSADYAMVDDDGYFWLLGRADEVLKVAGHRLGTMEVESAIVSHPSVAEAAVVGKADQIKGESIVAFVVPKEGSTDYESLRSSIIRQVESSLGAIARPESIYLVSRLPKTRSGKIMRRLLRAVVNGAQVGDTTTLEDEASVDEVKRVYEEFRHLMG